MIQTRPDEIHAISKLVGRSIANFTTTPSTAKRTLEHIHYTLTTGYSVTRIVHFRAFGCNLIRRYTLEQELPDVLAFVQPVR